MTNGYVAPTSETTDMNNSKDLSVSNYVALGLGAFVGSLASTVLKHGDSTQARIGGVIGGAISGYATYRNKQVHGDVLTNTAIATSTAVNVFVCSRIGASFSPSTVTEDFDE